MNLVGVLPRQDARSRVGPKTAKRLVAFFADYRHVHPRFVRFVQPIAIDAKTFAQVPFRKDRLDEGRVVFIQPPRRA